MSLKQKIQSINNGQFQPNYLLLGEETYLQSQFLDTLINKLREADEIDMVHIDLNEQPIIQVLEEAELYSFFTEYRLIIVENMTFLNSQTTQKMSDDIQKRVLAYLANPNPTSIIVWRMNKNQLDKRKKLTKEFLKLADVVNVEPLKPNEVQRYLQQYIQTHQIDITKDAIEELLVRVQYNLSIVMNEIVKLKNYSLASNQVTIEVVRSLVPRVLETDVFELTNEIMAKNANKAIQIYQDLILMKHEPIAILALIISQFRLIIQVTQLSHAGQLEQNIATQLGVHAYRVKLAMQLSRRYRLEDMTQFYLELIEADYQMKTGIGDKENAFYWLLTKYLML